LHRARAIAREAGLHYVYEGNIYSDAANTSCPGCGAVLIRRSWHAVTENRLRHGACPDCGQPLPGRWEIGVQTSEPLRNDAAVAKYDFLNL